MALALCLVALGGCLFGAKKTTMAPDKAPPTVLVTPVIQKTVPIYAEYVASIDPTTGAAIVDVRARVEAILMNQTFAEGTLVRKGQVLFLLDPRTYQANLNSARAALDKAKADYEYAKENVEVARTKADLEAAKAQLAYAVANEARLRPLAEQKAVPQQDYDNAVTSLQVAQSTVAAKDAVYKTTILNQKVSIEQARAAIESAKASIDLAEINLGYCTITSPIEGIAGKRLVAPGNLVGRGESTLLTTVTALDPLRINFSMSETDYLRMMEETISGKFKGLGSPPLELIMANGSKYPLQGKIVMANPTLDPKTGTLGVMGEFRNPQRLLRPGMFGRIRLTIDYTKDAILIPKAAIMTLQNAKVVYVVGPDNKVAMRTLELGDDVDKMVIVLKGVKKGERVIVEGTLKIQPGMVVRPTDRPVSQEPVNK